MRYALPALLLLATAALAGDRPRDFIFFVTPVVPAPPAPAPAPPTAGVPAPAPKAQPAPRPGAPAKPGATVDLEQVASALGSCVRCHSAGDAKPKTKPVVLFNEAGTFAPAVAPAAVYAAVKDDSMPLSGPKLSARDKDLLRRWAGIPATEVTP